MVAEKRQEGNQSEKECNIGDITPQRMRKAKGQIN